MNHSILVPTTQQLLVNVFLSLPRQPASHSHPTRERCVYLMSTRVIFPSALPSSSYNYRKISFRSRQPVTRPPLFSCRQWMACVLSGAPLKFPPLFSSCDESSHSVDNSFPIIDQQTRQITRDLLRPIIPTPKRVKSPLHHSVG